MALENGAIIGQRESILNLNDACVKRKFQRSRGICLLPSAPNVWLSWSKGLKEELEKVLGGVIFDMIYFVCKKVVTQRFTGRKRPCQ